MSRDLMEKDRYLQALGREPLGRTKMNKRLRKVLAVAAFGAAGAISPAAVAQAQAPARVYAPPAGYSYRTYSSGGRTYYYYAPSPRSTGYLVPNQMVPRRSRSDWAPYHKPRYYDWSTSREVPYIKPWMRPYH